MSYTCKSSCDFQIEEHTCPYCQAQLSCCKAPPFHVGDGLGWGTEYYYVCLNDECKLFTNSWQQFEDRYGHNEHSPL